MLLAASVLGTGALAVLRLVPFEPACSEGTTSGCYAASVTGPYTLATAADRSLAAELTRSTSPGAIFLTGPSLNDPIPMLAGRPIVMGYAGWLWSYGIDYTQRQHDIATAYAGCGAIPLLRCQAILDILHRYHVSYVEIESDQSQPRVDASWWAAQNLPIVARDSHIIIYDVRRP